MPDEDTPTSDPVPPTPEMPAPPSGSDLGFGASRRSTPSGLSMGGRRTTARPESGIRRQGGILMMAGAAIVLASLPLPEVTVSRGGVSQSVNGMHGVALWLLIICVFAFLRGYSAVKPAGFRTSLPIISGIVVTWAIYTRWQDIDSAMKVAAGDIGLAVSPGIGFWLTCVGGVLIVVGSLILQFVQPQRV